MAWRMQALLLGALVVLAVLVAPAATSTTPFPAAAGDDVSRTRAALTAVYQDLVGLLIQGRAAAPGNGTLSPPCQQQVDAIGLAHNGLGYEELLDAFGKPESGILEGNTNFLGDFDECMALPDTEYCSAMLLNVQVPMSPTPLRFGVCIPTACEAELSAAVSAEAYLTCQHRPASLSRGATWVVVLISVFAFLNVLATAVDVARSLAASCSGRGAAGSLIKSADIQSPEEATPFIQSLERAREKEVKESLALSLLGSFSISRNLPKLCKTAPTKGTLTCVQGIRTLSMMWVVLGHVYFWGLEGFFNNPLASIKEVGHHSFAVIDNAFLSVDTFFFLSGLLVTYGVMQRAASKKGSLGVSTVPLGYLHRYLRLTPVMLFIMLVSWQLLSYTVTGPMWAPNSATSQPCDKNWWANLLYIQNVYPKDMGNECIGWTWYLANDMQMFLVGLPLSILIALRPRVGLALTAALSVGCLIAAFALSYRFKLRANIMAAAREGGKSTSDYTYVKPWFRIQPYIVGMFTAYALINVRGRIPTWLVATAHLLAAALGAASWIAFNLDSSYEHFFASRWTQFEDASYLAFGRLAWGLFLGWLVFACVKGLLKPINTVLSLPVFAITSRLTYTAYLVHPLILTGFYQSKRSLVHYELYQTIVNYFGLCTIVYCSAFVLTLCVEFPCAQLEKKLLR